MNDCILHVCRTGKKEQYYTLYMEGIMSSRGINRHFCEYQQNLSFELDSALDKANSLKKSLDENNSFWNNVNIEYHESPRIPFTKMDAFDTEFRLSKSGKVFWANASSNFWDAWKEDKQGVKDMGFWVKRTSSGKWLVFIKTYEGVENLEAL